MDRATQKIDMPAGGIGDFIYTDEELDILEAKELEEAFGKDGIAQFKDVGKKIAEYGRYGDDTVAHVETGELIVPRALIENNPELKESIFSHLKELGVEDPERYVVGTKKNSINPDTGLPEFFLSKLFKGVKKGISSIGKGVSKAFKSVGKALKKVAPIVLPIVLGMTPLGPIYGAALGSGISTLMQGGDLGDAVKSAALAGGVGAIYSGASSAIAGKGFGTGVSEALAGPGARFSQTLSDPFSSYQPTSASNLTKPEVKIETLEPSINQELSVGLDDTVSDAAFGMKKAPSTFDSIKDFGSDLLFGKDATQTEIFAKAGQLQKNAAAEGLTLSSKQALEMAKKELAPGFLRKYGPTAGLAGLGLYAAGAFDAPEEERLNLPESGLDIYNRNPDIFNVAGTTPNLATGPFKVPTTYTFNYTPYRVPPFQRAAEGGEIFPRRNGGIGPNEGTPGKDSVRAMLMPGEFVMTTDAVKGLGNGDLNTGIKNMYSVMSKLEKKGKAMA